MELDRISPRLDRPGRGRPDPPAGRASGQPSRHAQPPGLPPRRRGRDRRMLARRAGGPVHALDHGPVASEGTGRAHRPVRREPVGQGRL